MERNDLIRVIAFTIVGALMMFLGQAVLLRARLVRINVPSLNNWVASKYVLAASIVFAASFIAMALWIVMAVRSSASESKQVEKWMAVWWIVGIFPLLSIGLALKMAGIERNTIALIWLSFFFLLDFLWLFWFTTATSTPGILKYVPPGSFYVRRLIGAS